MDRRQAWKAGMMSWLGGLVLLQQGGCEFTGLQNGINQGVASILDVLIQAAVLQWFIV
jgi:hypothetical protein